MFPVTVDPVEHKGAEQHLPADVTLPPLLASARPDGLHAALEGLLLPFQFLDPVAVRPPLLFSAIRSSPFPRRKAPSFRAGIQGAPVSPCTGASSPKAGSGLPRGGRAFGMRLLAAPHEVFPRMLPRTAFRMWAIPLSPGDAETRRPDLTARFLMNFSHDVFTLAVLPGVQRSGMTALSIASSATSEAAAVRSRQWRAYVRKVPDRHWRTRMAEPGKVPSSSSLRMVRRFRLARTSMPCAHAWA